MIIAAGSIIIFFKSCSRCPGDDISIRWIIREIHFHINAIRFVPDFAVPAFVNILPLAIFTVMG